MAIARSEFVENPNWGFSEPQNARTVSFMRDVDLRSPLGHRILLLRTGETWRGVFSNIPRKDPQGDPRAFLIALGNREAGRIWGYEEIDDFHLIAPSSERLNKIRSLVNSYLPDDRKIPFFFYSADEASPPEYLQKISSELIGLPMSPRGNLLLHDLSTHIPIMMPPELSHFLRNRARVVLGLAEHWSRASDKMVETDDKNLVKKYITAFLKAEAEVLDIVTGNFCIFLNSIFVTKGLGISPDDADVRNLYTYGFQKSTFNGLGLTELFDFVKKSLKRTDTNFFADRPWEPQEIVKIPRTIRLPNDIKEFLANELEVFEQTNSVYHQSVREFEELYWDEAFFLEQITRRRKEVVRASLEALYRSKELFQ